MTKEKLENTEALVRKFLENDEEARCSDNYLYLRVCDHISLKIGQNLFRVDVPHFLLHMKEYGYPPFETVRRSRQKLQRKFPELRANKEVAEQRADNETAYRQFVKEEVCS